MYALYFRGVRGSIAMCMHHCDGFDANVEPGVSAWDREIDAQGSPHPDDLGMDSFPEEPGYYVWVGHIRYMEDDIDWLGRWSPATRGEVLRFMLKRPPGEVFALRSSF